MLIETACVVITIVTAVFIHIYIYIHTHTMWIGKSNLIKFFYERCLASWIYNIYIPNSGLDLLDCTTDSV
jgi:hypothetical protein